MGYARGQFNLRTVVDLTPIYLTPIYLPGEASFVIPGEDLGSSAHHATSHKLKS